MTDLCKRMEGCLLALCAYVLSYFCLLYFSQLSACSALCLLYVAAN